MQTQGVFSSTPFATKQEVAKIANVITSTIIDGATPNIRMAGNLSIGGTTNSVTGTARGRVDCGTGSGNRTLIVYQGFGTNSDHVYMGLGINASAMRYQVDDVTSSHVFYGAIDSSSSRELMRINGGGAGGPPLITTPGNFTATGAISGASVSATGAISGASVSATGAISGASVSATGAISATSVSATGAISATSVSASGAISGASLTATGDTISLGSRSHHYEFVGSNNNFFPNYTGSPISLSFQRLGNLVFVSFPSFEMNNNSTTAASIVGTSLGTGPNGVLPLSFRSSGIRMQSFPMLYNGVRETGTLEINGSTFTYRRPNDALFASLCTVYFPACVYSYYLA